MVRTSLAIELNKSIFKSYFYSFSPCQFSYVYRRAFFLIEKEEDSLVWKSAAPERDFKRA